MPTTAPDDPVLSTAPALPFETMQRLSVEQARQAIRDGRYGGHTAGIADGFLQGNLVILPADHALDFARYCQRNPKPCPLVGVSDTGDPMLRTLGRDIDVRSDVSAYHVYRDGELVERISDIGWLWRDDLVAFVLGCSFTFEQALIAEGIRLRHIDNDTTVPMFRSSIATTPAGPFAGDMVVTMRPIREADVFRAAAITARYPQAHGGPVHFGDPARIGITDLENPDWGDPTEIRDGEIAVFWACGVTPQVAIRAAKPPLCITHAPGRMLITDVRAWQV